RLLHHKDVHLYRTAFQGLPGAVAVNDEIREAALGSATAALRLAHRYREGEQGLPADEKRYLGWLQFAAALGSAPAAYELALHFREQGQPVLAAQYETRAVSLGHHPPPALDHVRK